MERYYHDLPQSTQAYLHSLEILECYRKALALIQDKQLAMHHFTAYLSIPSNWQESVTSYVTSPMSDRQMKRELVLYYLIAGAPINQIMQKLNVGQATVYKIKNTPAQDHFRNSPIEELFTEHFLVSIHAASFLDIFNAFDNYRIPRFDNSWKRT